MATLKCEPTNPYDCNAVMIQVDGTVVAYLKRKDALAYCGVLGQFERAGIITQCEALICGGWDEGPDDRGHFGIKLALASPDAVAALLA